MRGILIAIVLGVLGMVCLGPSFKAFYDFDDDAQPLSFGQKVKAIVPAVLYLGLLIGFLAYAMA